MDFHLIKKILEKEGKVVIVEDGKPTMIVSRIEEYLKEDSEKPKEVNENQERIFLPKKKEEGLTIDDLPL